MIVSNLLNRSVCINNAIHPNQRRTSSEARGTFEECNAAVWKDLPWPSNSFSFRSSGNPLYSQRDIRNNTNLERLAFALGPLTEAYSLRLERRIQSVCRHLNSKILHLAAKGLSLPPDLRDNPHLVKIDLSRNRLTEAPDLRHTPRLKFVYLSRNQITESPNFSLNPDLLHLYFLENQLVRPPDLNQNPRLEFLYLGGNRLTVAPDLRYNTHLKYVDLSNNRLTDIPLHYACLPSTCTISLQRNLLSSAAIRRFEEEIQRQRVINPDLGPTVIYFVDDDQRFLDEPISFEEELQTWISECNRHGEISLSSFLKMKKEDKETLQNFLTKLRRTKDYRADLRVKEALLSRLHAILSLASKNPSFQEKMIAVMADGLENCSDRVILYFGQIDMLSQWHALGESDLETLADLAIRIQRYDVLVKHALEQAKIHQFCDEIETALYYVIHLKTPLCLPIHTQGMLYPDMSGVTREMLVTALNEVFSFSRLDLISISDYWRSYLENRDVDYQKELNDLNCDYENQLGKVIEDHSVIEINKRSEIDLLIKRREEAICELTKKHTLKLLPKLKS